MIRLEDAVIAKFEKDNEKFEILIEPEAAQKIKNHEKINILENLVVEIVFKDSKKGLKASEEKIKKIFNTTDIQKIAEIIVINGEIQLTTEQKEK